MIARALIYIFKPNAGFAKWLLFLLIAAILWVWTNGYFEAIKSVLGTKEFTLEVGKFSITLYDVIRDFLSIILILWVASIVSGFLERQIQGLRGIHIGNKIIIQKVAQIILYTLTFFLTLDVLKINLSSLTVLGGAIGIGLGFGMQKIAANFISGIILLLEHSLKPGDFIELKDGILGVVQKSTSRSTRIKTIDGKEIIVPNEEFINNRIVNWTLSDATARITVNIGVAYDTDLDLVQKLVLDVIGEHQHTLNEPAAVCWLNDFGDSSIDFQICFWIDDIKEGYFDIKSEILLGIWRAFKNNDITIPFPQRDLNIK